MRLSFDHGTLKLLDQAPHDRAAELPGVLWDPRVSAFRAPAYRYADVLAALDERGITKEDPLAGPLAVPVVVRCPELRPYQAAALASWEAAERRGILVMPTGSGKTRTAIAAAASVGRPTLCLVPTRILLEPWLRAFEESSDLPVGQLGDGARDVRPITVATFESAYRSMAELGGRFALLIVDEAHHFGRGLRDETLAMCAAPQRLGLTATLPDDDPATGTLEELLGPIVTRIPVDALRGTYLSAFDHHVIPVALDRDEAEAHRRWVATFRRVHDAFRRFSPHAPWPVFVRAAMKTSEGRAALYARSRAERLLALPRSKVRALASLLARHRGDRVLVFTADNDSAYEVARRFLVMPLTCDIGRREREHALGAFREGRIRTLVSSQVLNEGVDVPEATVAIVAGARLGPREYVQRVGRVLRPAPGKRAQVYELVVVGTADERRAERKRRTLASG